MIAVGAIQNAGNNINGVNSAGHVRIYRLEDDGMSWEQIGEDIDGEAEFDELGHSVSLSANGSAIVIMLMECIWWVTSGFTVWRTMV